MSDFTAVNAASMQEGISSLQNAHRALTDHLDTLESQLGSSLAKWDGAAQAAYHQAKAEWDKAARHMQEVVNKMGSVLGQITENYDSNERKIQSNWG